MKRLIFAAAALLGATLAHAETAYTSAAAELKQDAAADAPTVATLTANTRLEVLRRRGGWTEVKSTDGKTGWVRMLALRFDAGSSAAAPAPAAARPAANPLASLGNLLTPNRNSSAATVTTGVRGLGEEDLAKAQPNAGEFKKMQSFAASKNTATEFARSANLNAQKVDYLKAVPAPAPSRTSENRDNNADRP